jgi:hypothetical protein
MHSQLIPMMPRHYVDLACWRFKRSEIEKAMAYLKNYLRVSPDAVGFAMLGGLYATQHRYSASRDACAMSYALDQNVRALSCLAASYFELKDYREAAATFEVLNANAAHDLAETPVLLYVAGKSYDGIRECQKAVEAYKLLLPMMTAGSEGYAEVRQRRRGRVDVARSPAPRFEAA